MDNALLGKNSNLQAKDGYTNIRGTIIKNGTFEKETNILIIDDLYSTGATLNEITKVLKSDKNVKNVYVLAMTKTRR